MTMFSAAWQKLKKSKRYREEYALSMLKRMVPFQIRAIRKKLTWSQAELAQRAQLTQGVVSRAEDPGYGNLTLNTIGRIAAGFDLAFVGKFVAFSELVRFTENLSEREFAELLAFEKEDASKKPAPIAREVQSEKPKINLKALAAKAGARQEQGPPTNRNSENDHWAMGMAREGERNEIGYSSIG